MAKQKKKIKRRRAAEKAYSVLIGIPVPMMDKKILDKLSGFIEGLSYRHLAIRDSIIGRQPEFARNKLIDRFLNDPEYKGFTHLMFIDADTVPLDPYALDKLLSHNKDVIAGITPVALGTGEVKKLLWNVKCAMEDEKIRNVELWETPKDLFKCLAVGGTTILMKRKVLEKLKIPYQQQTMNETHTDFIQGEDYYFCDNIREAGFDIWIDPTVVCQHFHVYDLLTLAGQLLDAMPVEKPKKRKKKTKKKPKKKSARKEH